MAKKKRGRSAAFMRSINPFLKKKKSRSTRRGLNKMAKKRRFSRKSSSYGMLGKLLGAALYGGVREKISEKMQPITANVPLGTISDEVAIGGAAYLGKKFVGRKFPMANPFFDAAMIIEAARIGSAFAAGQVSLSQ